MDLPHSPAIYGLLGSLFSHQVFLVLSCDLHVLVQASDLHRNTGYVTTRCAMWHFTAANPHLSTTFHFMDEGESLSYSEVGAFKTVALIPWDHALMTFFGWRKCGWEKMLHCKRLVLW